MPDGTAGAKNAGPDVGRFIPWFVVVIVLQGLVLILLGWIVPGFSIGGGTIVVAAILTTLAQAIAWPFVYQLAARVHPVLFPLLSFAVAGLLIVLLSDLFVVAGVGRMHVENIWTGILVACGLTVGSTILGVLFSPRDDTADDWFVTRPLRRRYRETLPTEIPGVLFLEIDGLAEPVLPQVIAGDHLRRTDGFANAPDILVMGAYDPATDEVAAFKELVGSHGGLGGPQTHPFVFHLVALDPGPDPIVGAAALHRVLRRWLPSGGAGRAG